MGWSIGWDPNWSRDIGYGVPAYCDHPDCDAEIDRGLAYVCGGNPYGGANGCGLFFCEDHHLDGLCDPCEAGAEPFVAKPDHPRWVEHKLTHESWAEWRAENPDEVARLSGTP